MAENQNIDIEDLFKKIQGKLKNTHLTLIIKSVYKLITDF